MSFLISAWMTYILVLFTYLFVDGALDKNDEFITRFDISILEIMKEMKLAILSRMPKQIGRVIGIRSHNIKSRIQEIFLASADQQLITGTSILIVGYSKHCDITQYHFYIATQMTTISFATYQAVILLVRDALRGKWRKSWRVLWITVIAACVTVSNFVIYNDNFLVTQHLGHSMHCVWENLKSGQHFTRQQLVYLVFGIGLDLWSYFGILSYLYPDIFKLQLIATIFRIAYYLMELPSRTYLKIKTSGGNSRSPKLRKILETTCKILFILALTLREVLFSFFFDLLRIFTFIVQITVNVADLRNQASKHGRDGDEDTWGYGQILPMLLLALPLLAFLELLSRKSEK